MPQNSWRTRRVVGLVIMIVLMGLLILTYRALSPSQPISSLPTSPLFSTEAQNEAAMWHGVELTAPREACPQATQAQVMIFVPMAWNQAD